MTPGSRLRRSLELVDAPARAPHQPQRRAGRGRPGLPGESRPTTKRIPPGDDTESLPGCMGPFLIRALRRQAACCWRTWPWLTWGAPGHATSSRGPEAPAA